MKVALTSVIVEGRYRRALGDLDGLAASIKRVGLLHPIVVTSERRLIAGERRLRAAEQLGWSRIDARVIDLDDPLLGERDENEQRKALTPSEAVAVAKAIEGRERERAKERMLAGKPSAESAEGSGDARDKVAEAVGLGRTALKEAREVVEAAEEDPEQFGDLVERMDAAGKVSPFQRELQERRRAAGISNKQLIVDPLEEHPCPGCGRYTPAWVLGRAPRPEGSRWRWSKQKDAGVPRRKSS